MEIDRTIIKRSELMGLFSGTNKNESRQKVIILTGHHFQDFGDGSKLKSDLAVATSLPIERINEIVQNVETRLAQRRQPVLPHDITTTTHVVMLEMGLKRDADLFINFIRDRYIGRKMRKFKITYIKCEYCGATNNIFREKCFVCAAPLNKDKIYSKFI